MVDAVNTDIFNTIQHNYRSLSKYENIINFNIRLVKNWINIPKNMLAFLVKLC